MPYHVYVVELDPEKFNPPKKFRKQNDHIWGPDGNGPDKDTQFFYVGQSAHEPECRFSQHKHCFGENIEHSCICGMECTCCDDGHIIRKNMSNSWVRVHGLWLRKRKFSHYNPIDTQENAKKKEKWLAEKLRKQGHASYFA